MPYPGSLQSTIRGLFAALFLAAVLPSFSATLVWDFEGNTAVENNPVHDRLYDQGGTLKFHLVTPSGGNTFDRFAEGAPSNPVRYDAISDESSISTTPGGGAPNGLFLPKAEDDSVIISESRGGGFLQKRDWTNSELQAAGVTGQTEVSMRVADSTTAPPLTPTDRRPGTPGSEKRFPGHN